MRTLRARNVNDLYVQGLELLASDGVPGDSRAGKVVVAPWPVMSVYDQPMERVLFDERRDASPFFHLMEGLWMLAGRNDAEFLDRYIGDFSSRFSDDGVVHGAYGHRWTQALGYSQLDVIVSRLRMEPRDRQCVLQMWDATPTHMVEQSGTDNVGDTADGSAIYAGSNDLLGNWKDRPCNTHAYFRVIDQREVRGGELCVDRALDMTICCRSNDVVWGAYGANAVHFSMLQEYVAGRLGIPVGTLYQFSNNFHGYVEVLDGLGDPRQIPDTDHYDNATVHSVAMGENWGAWDADLKRFMQWHDHDLWTLSPDSMDIDTPDGFQNLWFHVVAGKMAQCRWLWVMKRRDEALRMCSEIEAPDWRMACQQWMERRLSK